MKKYDYFYNEQGDYTITKNSEPMAFVSSEKSAKIIIGELNAAQITNEKVLDDVLDKLELGTISAEQAKTKIKSILQ